MTSIKLFTPKEIKISLKSGLLLNSYNSQFQNTTTHHVNYKMSIFARKPFETQSKLQKTVSKRLHSIFGNLKRRFCSIFVPTRT
jgi:hypothetical protein